MQLRNPHKPPLPQLAQAMVPGFFNQVLDQAPAPAVQHFQPLTYLPQTIAGSWHSGLSPHKYELVMLPSNVRKCYGCGYEFTQRYRRPPHDIVVKHIDRRLMQRDEHTGQFQYSADFSNTYYHLASAHICRKNPLFTGQAYIASGLYLSLTAEQRHVIDSCDVNVILI